MHDRPRRPARTQDERRLPARIGAERLEESARVGVIGADGAVRLEGEGVRSADSPCSIARDVRQFKRCNFVGDGDVDAAKAACGKRAHRLGEHLGSQRELDVAPVVEADSGQGGVVDVRRARVRDGPAGDAEPCRDPQHFDGERPPALARAAS